MQWYIMKEDWTKAILSQIDIADEVVAHFGTEQKLNRNLFLSQYRLSFFR